MEPLTARSIRGTPTIVVTPSARAVSHTILGTVSVIGVLIEIHVLLTPKRINVVGARKRKATAIKKKRRVELTLVNISTLSIQLWMRWISIYSLKVFI